MKQVGSIEALTSLFLSFFLIHRYKEMTMAPKDNVSVGSKHCSKCLLLERDLSKHGGNLRCGAPHRRTFPIKDCVVRFEKTPPSGIWPTRLLNERFKLVKYVKLARNMGMVPERLLNERSNDAKLFCFSSVPGIEPSKQLCDKFRFVNILSCPKESGMLPIKKLEEISM
jgi:hypothetical protein